MAQMAVLMSRVLASSVGLVLGGEYAALQTSLFDGFSFNPFALLGDVSRSAELGVGRRYVVRLS